MAELGKTVLPVAIPVVAKLATLAATPFQASKRVDEQVRFFIVWFMTFSHIIQPSLRLLPM